MPRRTAVGREMMRRTLGFAKYIKTAETRQQAFAERANIFTAYLPYAIAFKCVDRWAQAFQDIDMQTATAAWYSGSSAFNPSSFSSNFGSFSSSVSRTITSSPGGSGGSGFSGGRIIRRRRRRWRRRELVTTTAIGAVAAGLVVLVLVLVVLYNGFVRARQRVREAWSAIDVQLQRRASLVPNLVESVKGYAAYERETLQRVVAARSALGAAATPAAAARANADLTGALGTFFALAEAYPDLKASERFAQLQTDLTDTENKIAFARNYYNGAVEAYNIKIQTLPGVVVAGPFGFRAAEFFAADP
jgi:LemA protein